MQYFHKHQLRIKAAISWITPISYHVTFRWFPCWHNRHTPPSQPTKHVANSYSFSRGKSGKITRNIHQLVLPPLLLLLFSAVLIGWRVVVVINSMSKHLNRMERIKSFFRYTQTGNAKYVCWNLQKVTVKIAKLA